MVWSPSLSAFFPYTTLFRSPPLPAFVDHLLSNYPLCGLIERLLRRFLAYFACFFTPFLQRLLHLHARHLGEFLDRKSTRLNYSHPSSSYGVFCLKKKKRRI